MSKLREITSTTEFLDVLESSHLLTPDMLARVRELAGETTSCREVARQLVQKGWITKWQAGQLLVGASRFRLGKYVLKNQVGRGDFGRVYLALHPQLERDVAIKTLSRRFTQRPDIVERFLSDARQAAALDHAHVLHVYDIDSDDGRFYIVMEPIAGEDLRHCVESKGPLSIEAAARLLEEAAAGLAHAHERGVCHQTLQPASCMLDAQGFLKIVGFGMGRLAQADRLEPTSDIDPSQVAWRAAFTAPEQRPEDESFDARCDLYALGCTAYFALTGRVPAVPGNDGKPANADGQLTEVRSDIPAGLATLIGRLMAPAPQDRLASAVELGQAIRDLKLATSHDKPLVSDDTQSQSVQAFDWKPEAHDAGRVGRRDSRNRKTSSSSTKLPVVRSRNQWLGFYIALALSILVIGAVLVYWFTRSGENVMISQAGQRPVVRGNEQAKSGKSPDAAQQPSSDSENKDKVGQPASGAADKSSPKSNEAVPPADATSSPDEAAKAPTAGTMSTENSPPGTPAAPENPNSPPPPSTESPKPETSPPPETPKPEATPPTEQPKPGVPPPNVPPPNVPPQPEPSPTPVPPTNPFEGWSEALDLLPLDKDAAASVQGAVDIGKSRVTPNAPSTAVLLGGSQTGAAATRFEIAGTVGGDASGWELAAVENPSGGPTRRVVARVISAADRLQFVWDAGATECANANHLANCVLRFTNGTFRHDVRLRKPLPAEPLQVSMKKQPDPSRAKLVASPGPGALRFQVTGVDEPLPKTFSLTPADPVPVDGTVVKAGFGEDPANPILLLDITPEMKNVFLVQGQLFFRLTAKSEPVLWSAKKFQTVANLVAVNQEAANLHAQQVRNQLIGIGATDPTRAAVETELKAAEARLAECTQATQAIEYLVATRDTIAKGGAVHFRLFMMVEDCEVELVRSR